MARLIAIGGMSGSGKTSLAAALAQKISNAIHLDSDRTRKELFGVPLTERLPPEAYTHEATLKLIGAMDKQVRDNLAAGKNVVISAAFLTPESRVAEETLAKGAGADFLGLWLEADVKTLCDRVEKRTGDASDAGVSIVKMQAEGERGVIHWPMIDATKTREDVLKEALALANGDSGKPRPPGFKP